MVSFNWISASIEPSSIELPVVCWTKNNKLMVLKNTYGFYNGDASNKHSDWDNLVNKYHIERWVYQEHLMK